MGVQTNIHLCGALRPAEMTMLLKPGNKTLGCLTTSSELLSANCSFLHKIINDLACVKRVKERFVEKKLSGTLDCHCAISCHSYEYDMGVSTSVWPSQGYEMYTAYREYVLKKQWNYRFRSGQEFSRCPNTDLWNEHLSDFTNKGQNGDSNIGQTSNNDQSGQTPQTYWNNYQSNYSDSGPIQQDYQDDLRLVQPPKNIFNTLYFSVCFL